MSKIFLNTKLTLALEVITYLTKIIIKTNIVYNLNSHINNLCSSIFLVFLSIFKLKIYVRYYNHKNAKFYLQSCFKVLRIPTLNKMR